MPVSAQQVLDAHRHYRKLKKQYKIENTATESSAAPAVETLSAESPKVKHKRRPRDPTRARTEKERANDERLKRQTALAREIRAKDPSMKWVDCIKKAAAEMKKE
jgi:hypothetical protein